MPSTDGARPRWPSGFDMVVHADWSAHPAKRWLAVARRVGDQYAVEAPIPAPIDLLGWLTTEGARGSVLLGLDVPLGVPAAWGALVGIGSFRELLEVLMRDEARAASFFAAATRPEEIGPWRPFYPARPGGSRRVHLLEGLGLASMYQLLRQCDQATDERSAAGALFWTLGPKQPGKAAISAWRDILLPAIATLGDRVGLWPFDGVLNTLRERSVVIAEAYPAELGLRLGLEVPGRGWSKRRRTDRVRQGQAMLAWAGQRGAVLSRDLHEAIVDGFGDAPTGEDRFDAVVGVLGMLSVLGDKGWEAVGGSCRELEGWSLGLD